MRLTVFFLFITVLHVCAKSYSQRITIHQRNISVHHALDEIKKQTGYSYIADRALLKNTPPLDLNLDNASLPEALQQCLRGLPCTYTLDGEMIVIKQKPLTMLTASATDSLLILPVKIIQGRVTDSTGKPLEGVAVIIKGTKTGTTTDKNGYFSLSGVDSNGILTISYIGYKQQDVVLHGKTNIAVTLKFEENELNAMIIYTGYQKLKPNEMTGSFDIVDSALLNRSVSPNILDHINGLANSVLFNPMVALSNVYTGAATNIRGIGVTIRGTSTLSPNTVGTDPLIVVDNFPFDGDLRNINPNDVASVTILKDAAAASIWGARAGNGVIVITTKKGKKNQKAIIEFNSNVTIGNKPNLYYDKNYLDSKDFIQLETYLYNAGYFASNLSNTSTYPVVSPVVELLNQQQAGKITAASATSQLNALADNDVRNDFEKYVYQKTINQQYAMNIRGGTDQVGYAFSAGYDNDRASLIRNGQTRLTLSTNNTYTPIKNLDISVGANYSTTNIQMNNQESYGQFGSGGGYGLIPYEMLAGSNGSALAVTKDYRQTYVDSLQKTGYQDIHYRPLSEINNGNYYAQLSDLVFKSSVSYRFLQHFNAQVLYQNERQTELIKNDQAQGTYYTDNLIDTYAQYNATTKVFTYPFPLGDVFTMQNYTTIGNKLRGQFNYNQNFGRHSITALAGTEVNESVTSYSTAVNLGYDPEFGTSVNNIDFYDAYAIHPSGNQTIANNNSSLATSTYRYVSSFANIGYSYDDRYSITASARRDGANIFGVNTNDRFTPLWSTGLGWNASNEKFYSINWLPYLKLRATYGFNGNVYNGTAYTKGTYFTDSRTGFAEIVALNAPNPDLSWEKVKNVNIGIDFATKANFLSGSVEIFRKDGIDLLENVTLPTSTGFSSYTANAAATRTNGIDVTLNSKNLRGAVKWSTTLLATFLKSTVIKYDPALTSSSIQGQFLAAGYAVNSVFSYKWAGIDQANGNPMGYLNGKVSEDYSSIINNFKPDSLKYNGSATPTAYGSLRNDVSYKGFALSVNIRYELGFYFRRPSVNLNYVNNLATPNSDYALRWQYAGQQTDVPSLAYPTNTNRNTFYEYSSILVQNGDNIRLQDIRLSYDITRKVWHRMPFANLQVYSYASNLGIIWKANKYNLDPDAYASGYTLHTLKDPFSIAFGINATY